MSGRQLLHSLGLLRPRAGVGLPLRISWLWSRSSFCAVRAETSQFNSITSPFVEFPDHLESAGTGLCAVAWQIDPVFSDNCF